MTRVRTAIAAELVLLFGMAVLAACAFFIDRASATGGAIELGPPLRMILVALPAMLWLAYWRARESAASDPRPLVIGMFVAGALIAGPVAEFVVSWISPMPATAPADAHWLSSSELVHAFLVVAMTQELTKFVILRYSVYPLGAIAQPIDGLVYATALGLGFASYRGYLLLSAGDGDVVLPMAIARIIITTLGHASFAAALGLALGWAKFVPHGALARSAILLAGLVAAALLSGAFTSLGRAVATVDVAFDPWRGMVFAFGFAVAVMLIATVPLRALLVRYARLS